MMTERERLIEIIGDLPFTDEYMSYNSWEWAEHFADHLLSNGAIVPPCKVGDEVYIVENPYTYLPLKKTLEGEVVSIHRHEHGLYLRVLFDTKKIHGCRDYNLDWCLGKTVFLTREEAEKALKERS